jgi:hypothetical protein
MEMPGRRNRKVIRVPLPRAPIQRPSSAHPAPIQSSSSAHPVLRGFGAICAHSYESAGLHFPLFFLTSQRLLAFHPNPNLIPKPLMHHRSTIVRHFGLAFFTRFSSKVVFPLRRTTNTMIYTFPSALTCCVLLCVCVRICQLLNMTDLIIIGASVERMFSNVTHRKV